MEYCKHGRPIVEMAAFPSSSSTATLRACDCCGVLSFQMRVVDEPGHPLAILCAECAGEPDGREALGAFATDKTRTQDG